MGHFFTHGRCLECQWIIGDLDRCSHCGLIQTGAEADRIRRLLTEADGALRVQRALSAQPSAAASQAMPGQPTQQAPSSYWPAQPQAAAVPSAGQAPPHYPTRYPPVPSAPTAPALTTPTVLLGLGALCVVVAAVVFVSVAWSGLSLGVKALVLLAVTSGIAALTWSVLRRGLRASAEALALLSSVLVVVDFIAAQSGGLFGWDSIGDRQAMWVASGLAVVAGLGWARAAVFTRTRLLTGVQVLALLGVWRLVMLGYDQHWTRIEYVAFAIVVVLVVAAAVAARLALWTFAVFIGVFAVVNLMIAFGSSLVRVAGEDTVAGIWSSGRSIGWVACLLLAWLAAVTTRLPMAWRSGAAAVVAAGTSFLVLRPVEGAGYDAVVTASVAVFAALAACTLVTRNPWRRGLRIGSVPVGLFSATLIGPSLLNAVGSSLTPALDPWSMTASAHPDSELVLLDGIGTPWLIGLAAFVLMVAVEVVVTRRIPGRTPVLAMAATAIAVATLRYSMPIWAIVAVLVALALAMAALAIVSRSQPVAMAAGVFGALAFGAALGSDVTTAVVAVVFAIALAGLASWVPGRDEATLAAASAVVLVGLASVAWLHHIGEVEALAPYVLVGLGVGSMLAAQYRRAGRYLTQRTGLEIGGLTLSTAAVAIAAGFGEVGSMGVQLPLVMTVAGAGLVALALLSHDRRLASVAGGVVLLAASWVRLSESGVTAVEAYTLPAALVLLTLGVVRMVRHPGSPSIAVLLPGLTLALLPSLWVAVAEPTSLRALLLGIAATGTMLAGAYLRWVAPLLVGAGVLLVLAGVNLAPYTEAIPRWVLFAVLGGGLLFLGITWEKRLRNARTLIAAVERLA